MLSEDVDNERAENIDGIQVGYSILYRFIKRAFDIVVSFIGCIICIPVFIVIGICIKIDSKGSVFFKHKRIGYKGRSITILKFRTMVENAEDLIADFTPEQLTEWKKNFKLEKDPRITRVGRILRKTSLDELPQLLEVFTGKLSFVGPRPITEEEFCSQNIPVTKYTSVRPGLTGYWACNGRSNIEYEERVHMELYYVDNASVWLDFKILCKTCSTVIRRDGAV